MTYSDFLALIISAGIDAAKESYSADSSKCEGAIAGFEACRDKAPAALRELLQSAHAETQQALEEARETQVFTAYWHARCFEAEVEWTCNVVSAAMLNQGLTPIIPPTVRGVMAAYQILGPNAELSDV